MIGVAVANNVQHAVVERVRSINATAYEAHNEIFKWSLLKDSVVGLTVTDMLEFIMWLIATPFGVICTRENLTRKVNDLRHRRLATYQVMCPDGLVPYELSM